MQMIPGIQHLVQILSIHSSLQAKTAAVDTGNTGFEISIRFQNCHRAKGFITVDFQTVVYIFQQGRCEHHTI